MIPVFYRPEMAADLSVESISPSSSKPRKLMERWQSGPLSRFIEAHSFEPATVSDIKGAHHEGYVDGVFNLTIPNGFGTFDQGIADSLPYTVGSLVAATRHVLQNGGFALSPSSGFHHANYGHGGGFCTFNGLIVAAQAALAQGATVGILDGDAHYGDGTKDIIGKLALDIVHQTVGARFRTGRAVGAGDYAEWWYDAVEAVKGCDVVLYQAGADPYLHDPLGGQVSLKQLALRDHIVFSELPNVAWNLAGGYSDKVLDIHTETLLQCVK